MGGHGPCAPRGRRRYPGPPFGPGQSPAVPSLSWVPYCRLTAKGARFHDISIKLVKTLKCHRNVSKRPVIVPVFKNGLGKSPLDFLGFLYLLAFSHKELMAFSGLTGMFTVKMTKCRRMYTTPVHAKGSSDTPSAHAASCLCVLIPHLTQRGQSGSILNEVGYY